MTSNIRLMRQALALTAIAFIGGTVGYRLTEEGWTVLDAFYMTFITLTTIGFGEVHTLSDGGRLFTVVLVVFGLGAAATLAAQVANLIIEGNFVDFWRRRRMNRLLSNYRDHVIVCGFGRIGQAICKELQQLGVGAVEVENSPKRQELARQSDIPVVSGNATADMALMSAGIQRAKCVVAALSQDTDNVFVALSARDLNPDVIVVARAEDRTHESRMLKAGVSRVVFPAQLGGGLIARMVGEAVGLDVDVQAPRRATDVLGFDLKIFRNTTAGPNTVGVILKEADGLDAVALVRADGERVLAPAPDTVVQEMEAVVMTVDTRRSDRSDRSHRMRSDLDLSVGNMELDREHEQILEMVRRLEASSAENRTAVAREVLCDLLSYTEHHFRHEESLFQDTDYPAAASHAEEHRLLSAKVRQIIADEEYVHPDSLSDMLEDWVVRHIVEVDQGYVDYLEAKAKTEDPVALPIS